jgi:hypothetical protein
MEEQPQSFEQPWESSTFSPEHPYSEYRPHKRRNVLISNPSQFRDIAPYLDTGVDDQHNTVRVDLSCAICDRILALPEAVSTVGHIDADIEPLVVTPCGHLLGYHCLEIHCRYRDEDDEERLLDPPGGRNCPVCRFKFLYPLCRHRMKLRPYDIKVARHQQTPLTILEGGMVPEQCPECDRKDAEACISELVHELLPDAGEDGHYVQSAYADTWMGDMRTWLKKTMRQARNWRDEAILRW